MRSIAPRLAGSGLIGGAGTRRRGSSRLGLVRAAEEMKLIKFHHKGRLIAVNAERVALVRSGE
jgi:hypothetical protein